MAATIQNAVANRPANGAAATVQELLRRMEPGIRAALPSAITPERFTRIALSALSATPKLKDCEPNTFLAALMTAAQLGLEPNTPLGQAWLIPYWDGRRNRMVCQFQLGYRGMLDLAYRSGQVKAVQVRTVYEQDEFAFSYGLDQSLRHVPARSERGDPTHFYAVVEFTNGGRLFDVMTVEEVRAHAKKFSKNYDNGPWMTDFEQMAKKTILKRVLKYAPMAAEFMRGVAQDGAVREELADDMTILPVVDSEADFYEVEEVPENDK